MTFYLVFYLTHLLPIYPACNLTFYLAVYLAYALTFYLTQILTFYLTYSYNLVGILSDIYAGFLYVDLYILNILAFYVTHFPACSIRHIF